VSRNPAPAGPGLRPFLIIGVVVVLALVALVVGLYITENVRGERMWKAYEREARARGIKLTLTELAPPEIPDAENFAAIPVFEAAASSSPPPNPFKLPEPAQGKRPGFGDALTGQPPDLGAWQDYFIAVGLLSGKGTSPAKDVLAALESYSAPLAELEGAVERPKAGFRVDYTNGMDVSSEGHTTVCFYAGILLRLRGHAYMADGDLVAALRDLHTWARISEALADGSSMLECVAANSVLRFQLALVLGELGSHRWAIGDLVVIEKILASPKPLATYDRGMNGERGYVNWVHDSALTKGVGALIGWRPPEDKFRAALASLMLRLYPRGWVRISQTESNRYIDEMQNRIAFAPPRVQAEPGLLNSSRALDDQCSLGQLRYPFLMLHRRFLYEEVERSAAYTQATLDQTRIACALERYRLQQGTYPASLEPLTPEFLDRIPTDVMDGQPMRYRLEADGGFVLWSVGTDLKDEGARTVAKERPRGQPDWSVRIPAAPLP
jgi:hypothetical protein